jgi:head-tail adaptor
MVSFETTVAAGPLQEFNTIVIKARRQIRVAVRVIFPNLTISLNIKFLPPNQVRRHRCIDYF